MQPRIMSPGGPTFSLAASARGVTDHIKLSKAEQNLGLLWITLGALEHKPYSCEILSSITNIFYPTGENAATHPYA
jgi:hypothetical protein